MLEINKNPTKKDLNLFGLLFLAFWALVGGIAWWRFDAPVVARYMWAIAAIVTFVHYAVPPVRRYVFLGWSYATYPLGWVVMHVILGIVFYLVITPIGLIMRAAGKDPMNRKPDPQANTYWIEHEQITDQSRYFRQF